MTAEYFQYNVEQALRWNQCDRRVIRQMNKLNLMRQLKCTCEQLKNTPYEVIYCISAILRVENMMHIRSVNVGGSGSGKMEMEVG